MKKNSGQQSEEILKLTNENTSLRQQLQRVLDAIAPFKAKGKGTLVTQKDNHGEKKNLLVGKIANLITEMNLYAEGKPKQNYSRYISTQLNHNYTYLSNIFSAAKGITIQQFVIINRIEKVKELLSHGQFNLTEISYKLHYSSVAHLSGQFKKTTGFSPSSYLKMKQKEYFNA
jgi:AraC-like DNA-binding protein